MGNGMRHPIPRVRTAGINEWLQAKLERIWNLEHGISVDRERNGLSRCHSYGSCEEFVLIHRKIGFAIVIAFEIAVEPMGEVIVYEPEGFAKFAFAERGTATTRIVGDGDSKSFVLGCRPECSLAQSRVSNDNDAASVRTRVGFEIIGKPQ
jgi:hypothetical protein